MKVVKFRGKCKLCNLERMRKELGERVCRWRYEDKLSLEEIVKLLNIEIGEDEELKRKVGLVNAMNLSNHFRNHICVDKRVALVLHRPVKERAVYGVEEEVLQRELDLVKELEGLYLDLKEKYKVLVRSKKKSDIYILQKLVSEMRFLVSEISKLKRYDELVGLILEKVVDELSKKVAVGVNEVLFLLKGKVEGDEVLSQVSERIVDVFSEAIRNSVVVIKEEFGVKG